MMKYLVLEDLGGCVSLDITGCTGLESNTIISTVRAAIISKVMNTFEERSLAY
ncbi:uncharacterized protein PHALS_09005 [Plasmopara halstedii]|uniref:Uncharacterized protein n=1 Tax=Plasmopara halstedii TaxID=4781 RepID=A0A0P1AE14_PLAHL|nr:uncharacterized protein PHALS_09005 [Plasmopara halstedii]CEG38962.1 hypothetical protein PHALS_09005 [Plasmopara halstedii]|eukprot:XP_024575331.1 hypothetical protein PHALS_09005 [Plasmopara halstedii]